MPNARTISPTTANGSKLSIVSGIVFYRVGGAPEATTWSTERADGTGGSEFERIASAILDTVVAQESKQDATCWTTVRMIESFSIVVMEIVDNAIVLAVPGAMDAGLGDALFWGSLAFALAVAWVAAFPVNRWLIARGRGHAVVHTHHGH